MMNHPGIVGEGFSPKPLTPPTPHTRQRITALRGSRPPSAQFYVNDSSPISRSSTDEPLCLSHVSSKGVEDVKDERADGNPDPNADWRGEKLKKENEVDVVDGFKTIRLHPESDIDASFQCASVKAMTKRFDTSVRAPTRPPRLRESPFNPRHGFADDSAPNSPEPNATPPTIRSATSTPPSVRSASSTPPTQRSAASTPAISRALGQETPISDSSDIPTPPPRRRSGRSAIKPPLPLKPENLTSKLEKSRSFSTIDSTSTPMPAPRRRTYAGTQSGSADNPANPQPTDQNSDGVVGHKDGAVDRRSTKSPEKTKDAAEEGIFEPIGGYLKKTSLKDWMAQEKGSSKKSRSKSREKKEAKAEPQQEDYVLPADFVSKSNVAPENNNDRTRDRNDHEEEVGDGKANSVDSLLAETISDDVSLSAGSVEAPSTRRAEEKAFKIAKEIVSSEEAFLDILKLLNEDFRRHVIDSFDKNVHTIPMERFEAILKYLPEIQRLSQSILSDLRERVQSWSTTPGNICPVFVEQGPFLSLYSQWIGNYDRLKVDFAAARDEFPPFEAAVSAFEASPRCRSLSLVMHMLAIIQRLPKYVLLLTAYKKSIVDTDYPDNVTTVRQGSSSLLMIDAALAIAGRVAEHANLYLRRTSELDNLLRVQNMLGGSQYDVVKPSRKLVKEGLMMKMSRKGPQERMLILFNDVLLYAQPLPGGVVNLRHELSLGGMRVFDSELETENGFEFSIVSPKKSFILCAATASARHDWMEILAKTVADHESRLKTFSSPASKTVAPGVVTEATVGTVAPVWVPDARVTMCQLCLVPFSLFQRRHHCRACGKACCSACSRFRAVLPFRRDEPATRVCERCAVMLRRKDIAVTSTEPAAEALYNQLAPGRSHSFSDEPAKDAGADACGYLRVKRKTPFNRSIVASHGAALWETMWFKIKQNALFFYRGSEDAAPSETMALIGWTVALVDVEKQKAAQRAWYAEDSTEGGEKNASAFETEALEGVAAGFVVKLTHAQLDPVCFHVNESPLAEKWIEAFRKNALLGERAPGGPP